MNKEEIKHFKAMLKQGQLRHRNILLDDKFQKELLNIIKDYEKLQQENKELHNKIDKAIEDIIFCINGMKNEYACVDYRTDRELHTMVGILENTIKVLKDSGVDECE